ncbi:MAG TPA: hypothetical protein VI011_17855 [Asanoa sp.]
MAAWDPVDLLGELYEQTPRWRITRRWRYERGHPSIHATATIGPIPSRGTWFAHLTDPATEWSTEAAALTAVEKMMADYHEQVRHRYLYDPHGPLWQERPAP